MIVTVLSKIIDPSVAVVTPPAAATAEVPAVEVVELEEEAAFFLGRASIGNAKSENRKNEMA